jgi:hypothetical protein
MAGKHLTGVVSVDRCSSSALHDNYRVICSVRQHAQELNHSESVNLTSPLNFAVPRGWHRHASSKHMKVGRAHFLNISPFLTLCCMVQWTTTAKATSSPTPTYYIRSVGPEGWMYQTATFTTYQLMFQQPQRLQCNSPPAASVDAPLQTSDTSDLTSYIRC